MLQLLSRSYPLYINHIICEVCTVSSETEFAASLEWHFTSVCKACGDLLTLTNCYNLYFSDMAKAGAEAGADRVELHLFCPDVIGWPHHCHIWSRSCTHHLTCSFTPYPTLHKETSQNWLLLGLSTTNASPQPFFTLSSGFYAVQQNSLIDHKKKAEREIWCASSKAWSDKILKPFLRRSNNRIIDQSSSSRLKLGLLREIYFCVWWL